MNFNFILFWESLRNCLWCGSFSKRPGNPFCQACYSVFLKDNLQKSLQFRHIKGLSTFVLLEWPPDNPLLIKLMTHLKGSKQSLAWNFFARLFADRMEIMGLNRFQTFEGKKLILIPPPRKGGKIDHAYLWGRGLADILGVDLVDCLEFSLEEGSDGVIAQKNKNKFERTSIEFQCKQVFSGPEDELLFIFVDDIITTGSTASAAFFALGCPKNFMVWALAHRALLV